MHDLRERHAGSIESAPVRAVKRAKGVVVRRLPRRLQIAARDRYHRLRLRIGNNPLGAPDAYQAFLTEALPRLGRAKDHPVTYLEFGVYQGATLAAAVHAFDACGFDRARFVGFDSFEGLPSGSEREGWGSGWFVTSRATAEWNLKRHGVHRRVELIEGWFEETCTPDLRERIARADVVMLDCDLYSATATALRFVEPILADPCIVIFDDWFAYNSGESPTFGQVRAFHEMQNRHPGLQAERLGRVGHCGVAYLVRDDRG